MSVLSVLIIGKDLHHKNKIGLEMILNHLNYKYTYGHVADICDGYDLIYSPAIPIDISKFPKQRFIFGPHFSVFPNNSLLLLNNKHNNGVYIQPSEWALNVWVSMGVEPYIPIKVQPFPVEVNVFKPSDTTNKDKVFIYCKRREPAEIRLVMGLLEKNGVNYSVIDYVKSYSENDYLTILKESKYGIVIGAHESQGFAIQEALSCNVPLLVWNTRTMEQEQGSRYEKIACTTIPYWDGRCGEFFYDYHELETSYNKFIENLETYRPRDFILENLSVENCGKMFEKL